MNVHLGEAEEPKQPEPPLTGNAVVVVDSAWIARRDQALRTLERSMLWTYDESAWVANTARRQGEIT